MGLKTVVKSFASKLLAFQRSESKFSWILIAVFILILFNPFLPNQGWGSYIFHLLLWFIILSGILASSDERQILRQITVIGIFVVILDWISVLARNYLPRMALVVYALYAIVIGLITAAIVLIMIKSPTRSLSLAIGLIGQVYLTVLVGMLTGKFLKD